MATSSTHDPNGGLSEDDAVKLAMEESLKQPKIGTGDLESEEFKKAIELSLKDVNVFPAVATSLPDEYSPNVFADYGNRSRALEKALERRDAEILALRAENEVLKEAKAKSDEELEKEKAIILSLRDALGGANAENASLQKKIADLTSSLKESQDFVLRLLREQLDKV